MLWKMRRVARRISQKGDVGGGGGDGCDPVTTASVGLGVNPGDILIRVASGCAAIARLVCQHRNQRGHPVGDTGVWIGVNTVVVLLRVAPRYATIARLVCQHRDQRQEGVVANPIACVCVNIEDIQLRNAKRPAIIASD